MNCKEFSNLLDAYLDGALSDDLARRMRGHAMDCAECAQQMAVRQDCRSLQKDIEVPDEFSAGWRRMIREEHTMEKTQNKRNGWKQWIAVAAALVFVVGGTMLTRDNVPMAAVENGMMQYSASDMWTDDGASMANTAGAYKMSRSAVMETAAAEDGEAEKIIRSAGFTLKTLHYDEDLDRIQRLTNEWGGRVEYLSSNGDKIGGVLRSASLTLRIPANNLDAFLNGAQEVGRVTSLQQELEDVSDRYYDIQARLDTQKSKMERLQALLTAAENVSDLIEIENAIADAQYWIDSYTAQLQNYDSRVEYSTVRVTIQEIQIQESEEIGLGERIWAGLCDSIETGIEFLQDVMVFLVAALPWGLIVVAVTGCMVMIRKTCKRKRKEKK